MNNYFDKQGNYINCENLSLAEIYHRAFALGVESVAIGKRPQGEWIDIDSLVSKAICSKCQKPTITEPFGKPNFCPNCGADMRGKEE